jgi:hypothetical protein
VDRSLPARFRIGPFGRPSAVLVDQGEAPTARDGSKRDKSVATIELNRDIRQDNGPAVRWIAKPPIKFPDVQRSSHYAGAIFRKSAPNAPEIGNRLVPPGVVSPDSPVAESRERIDLDLAVAQSYAATQMFAGHLNMRSRVL